MLRWIVFAAFVVAGVLTAGIGAYQGWDEGRRADTWHVTDGRVAGFRTDVVEVKKRLTKQGERIVETKNDPIRVAHPVFQYADANGTVRENVALRSELLDEGTPPGTPVRVRFDPADPDRVEQVLSNDRVRSRVTMAIAGGLLFVLFGVVVLFAFSPRARNAKGPDPLDD